MQYPEKMLQAHFGLLDRLAIALAGRDQRVGEHQTRLRLLFDQDVRVLNARRAAR